MESLVRSSNAVLTGAFDAQAVQPTNQDARLRAERYDFQHPAVLRNVPPPTITWSRPLRWWSLDRRRRVETVIALRDQLLEGILRLGVRNGP